MIPIRSLASLFGFRTLVVLLAFSGCATQKKKKHDEFRDTHVGKEMSGDGNYEYKCDNKGNEAFCGCLVCDLQGRAEDE